MEPISHVLNELTSTREKTSAKTKVSRGSTLRAFVAKAAGWTFEKANDLPIQDDYINKTSWLEVSCELIEVKLIFHIIMSCDITCDSQNHHLD